MSKLSLQMKQKAYSVQYKKAYLFSIIWNDVVALYHHAFRVNETALRLSYPASPGLSSPLRALLLVA